MPTNVQILLWQMNKSIGSIQLANFIKYIYLLNTSRSHMKTNFAEWWKPIAAVNIKDMVSGNWTSLKLTILVTNSLVCPNFEETWKWQILTRIFNCLSWVMGNFRFICTQKMKRPTLMFVYEASFISKQNNVENFPKHMSPYLRDVHKQPT